MPAGYDGSRTTSRKLGSIVGQVMQQITHSVEERPDLILAAWPEILGAQFAGMTEALSFHEGVLVVKVKTATLYSLLAQREKGKILTNLRKRFPKVTVSNIVFRRG